MPNNPAAPVDDASYAAKEALLARPNLPVTFTLYAGIGPGTRPLSRHVPYKAYMGPSVGDLFFSQPRTARRDAGRTIAARRSASTAKTRSCWSSTRGRRRTKRAGRRECELSATRFALAMIEKYGLTGKLCHYSVGEGLPLIRDAKARACRVTAEVTPHHVFFDTAMITDAQSPLDADEPAAAQPGRPGRDARSAARRHGDYLATDHAPHTLDEKEQGVSGQPHLDTYGPFVTWLLVEQGFTPERIAAHLLGESGGVRRPPISGEVRPVAAGLRRLADGARSEASRRTIRREDLEDEVRLEPVRGDDVSGQRRGGVRAGPAGEVKSRRLRLSGINTRRDVGHIPLSRKRQYLLESATPARRSA